MKNIFVFTCVLFLASFFASSLFAQDSTSIKITLPKSEKWSTDSIKIYNFLHDKWTFFDKIDTTTNSCFIKFPCERAIEQNIYIKYRNEFEILILPNDTVEIRINEKGKPTFLKGKTYRENQITYNKLEEYFLFIEDCAWDFYKQEKIDVEASFIQIDSMKQKILTDLNKDFNANYTFYTYFLNELTAKQVYYFEYRTSSQSEKTNKNYSKYDKYKPNIKNLIDDNYPYTVNYIDLLYEEILKSNCTKTERGGLDYKYFVCAYEQVKKIENEQIRNYLTLRLLSSEIIYRIAWWSEEEKIFRELLREVKKNYPNNKQVTIIEEKAALYKSLAEGAPAPNFILKDQNNKKVSLSDFKGKYVFIAFIDSAAENLKIHSWYSNLFYKEYTDEKIAFLYIFVNGTEENWKNLISTQKVEGIHLFANQEQSKDLYEKYGDKVYTIKSSDYKLNSKGLDTYWNVAFINKDRYFISRLIYLGHNMDWVAKKILNGE